jgi:YVTN family beta-propeller protein
MLIKKQNMCRKIYDDIYILLTYFLYQRFYLKKNNPFRCTSIILVFGFIVFSFTNLVYSKIDTSGITLESNPRGIAINPITDIAVIANEKSDSVSIVDLNTQKVLSTIPVGKAPRGVAIDREFNIALVSNSHDNSLSFIDLDNYQIISTLPVGKEPEGIAIDSLTHKAFIVNHKDDFISVIDLTNFNSTITIPLENGSRDVAIDPALNLTLVVNEKDNNVSVIDMNIYQVSDIIQVGRKPQAVDINPETHLGAIVNEKDNSITVINLLNWQTDTISVGKHPIDVAINLLDNRALVICDEDRNLLVIDLNTNTIVQGYAINKLSPRVAVNNFTNIAGIVDDKTDSLTLIQLPNPVPEIKSVSPDTLFRGTSSTRLVIEGYGFIKSSSVQMTNADYELTTVFIDNHSLEVEIPAELLTEAETYQITVKNPSPEGGTSNPVSLQINNPVPTISTISPLEAIAGKPGLILTVYGSGFFDDTTVYINGISRPFTLISQTEIQTEFTAEDLEFGRYLEVTVSNPLPGGGISDPAIFTVLNPVPELTSINPASIIAGGPDFTLILIGNNFVKTSVVSFNNQQYPLNYMSKTQIEATIPLDAIKTPGNSPVKAINPLPGGGETLSLIFIIKPPLEVKIVSPSDGETINKARMIVKGTFKSDTKDVGITVNGIIAETEGNEWVANDVPLIIGTNTITATIKDNSGNAANASVTINTTDTSQPVELSPNITSGIAPLQVFFSVSTSFSPVSYQMDFEGDGIIDYTGTTFEDITYTYTSEGIFYPTLTVTDDQGNAYSDTIAITVLSKTEIDNLLKGKWEGMKEALVEGNIEGALEFFVERSKERYRSIFEALKDQFPVIMGTFIEFNIVNVFENIAEYEIVANEGVVLYSYPGIVIKDSNGIWKFKDF